MTIKLNAMSTIASLPVFMDELCTEGFHRAKPKWRESWTVVAAVSIKLGDSWILTSTDRHEPDEEELVSA